MEHGLGHILSQEVFPVWRVWLLVGMVGILVFGLGWHRVSGWKVEAGPTVVNLPLGTAAGKAVGLDGRVYGPLTFAVGAQGLAVADTYHEQLLWFGRGPVTRRALPGMLVEDMVMTPDGVPLVADNRGSAIWRVGAPRTTPLIKFAATRGYTEAIWHMGVTTDHLYVEYVRLGRGGFSVRLDEYRLSGQFVRQVALTQSGRQGSWLPLAGLPISAPVRTFVAGGNGVLYVEPALADGATPVIQLYRSNGQYLGQVTVQAGEPIQHLDLLGVNHEGWLYLGVNLTEAHRARVLIITSRGTPVTEFPVRAVALYAATYGRVTPNGTLYLDQSTATRYRLQTWRVVSYRQWRWGFFSRPAH
ncbi:hypothetical protein TPY_0224 [Sulfobacillus acidophilus TPY]|nr:hypothetical protein TPY_0224 [Sulfobacillus acidophilus TPY]